MLRRFVVTSFIFFLAVGILVVTFFRSAGVKYAFDQESNLYLDAAEGELDKYEVDYFFGYPGGVGPDHPLWFAKAARDVVWLGVNTDHYRRFELLLNFSDKRVQFAEELVKRGNPELSATTLAKAEKYLERAFAEVEMVENPAKAGEGYRKLARAALAHRKKLMELMFMYPEDAKPVAVELMNYSRRVYDMSALKIREAGELPPENPFDSPH